MAAVEPEVDQPQRGGFGEGDTLVGAQAGDIGGGDEFDELHVPREQRRGAGAVIGDDADGEALPVGFGAPPGVVAFEFDAFAGLVGGQAEGAGAGGVLAGIEILGGGGGAEVFRDDEDVGEVDRQEGVDGGGFHPHGEGIGGFDAGDGLGVDREGARRVHHGGDAGEGVGDVGGGEGGAVVEFDVLAEFELPGGVVDHFPGEGEAGDEVVLRIALDEAVIEVDVDRLVRVERVVVRVDRGGGGGHRHGDGLRVCRGGCQHERREGGGEAIGHDGAPGPRGGA